MKTVLIVDDSPLQALVLKRMLDGASYKTLVAKDGNEALDFIESNEIDLVISDINMPVKDGYELCKEIKTNPDTFNLPVILCTVLSSPESLIKGIEVGADSYITRPYNEELLLKSAEELLAMPPRRNIKIEKELILFEGKPYKIAGTPQHLVNFLLSTYRNIHLNNLELNRLREELEKAYKSLESTHIAQQKLLSNILPEEVANELLAYGHVKPLKFDDCSVLFVDFCGFSLFSSQLSPQEIVQHLSLYFDAFDSIAANHKLERIKTIGDGYMCVAGVPKADSEHAIHAVEAGLEIQRFVKEASKKIMNKYGCDLLARVGIHSGTVVAGVVGQQRFAYDIWGDTVNLASRMESHGVIGEVNISSETEKRVSDFFVCESRGLQPTFNKQGVERFIEMFLVKDKRR